MTQLYLGGLVLAAGRSSRMGTFKPLLPLRGKTVIENTIDSMLSAGTQQIVVVLGNRGKELEAFLCSRYPEKLLFAYNERYYKTDMLTSIRIGLAALPPCRAFFLLPGDMPLIRPETFRVLLAAIPPEEDFIIFPTLEGRRKHPPLISGTFAEEILHYDGPDGLRGFWKLHENSIVTVPVEDAGCSTDLDTPAQYQNCLEQLAENHGNDFDK